MSKPKTHDYLCDEVFKVSKKYHDLSLEKKYVVLSHILDWADKQKKCVIKEYDQPKFRDRICLS